MNFSSLSSTLVLFFRLIKELSPFSLVTTMLLGSTRFHRILPFPSFHQHNDCHIDISI